jgi:hypothetical protein
VKKREKTKKTKRGISYIRTHRVITTITNSAFGPSRPPFRRSPSCYTEAFFFFRGNNPIIHDFLTSELLLELGEEAPLLGALAVIVGLG